MALNVVILAAGQGKRMHSAQPKVLHLLAGRPIVGHVLAAARALAPRAIALVVGHGADAVRAALAAPDLQFVLQDPPRGTGDANRVALDALPPDGVTLVTIGDIPLVPVASLLSLVQSAQAGELAVLTAQVSDPAGLGRIVRDAAGRVRAIIEDCDLHTTQRKIDEINAGVLAAPLAWTADPDLALFTLVAVDVWKATPYMALLILAALQMVPADCLEAARVETLEQQLRTVTRSAIDDLYSGARPVKNTTLVLTLLTELVDFVHEISRSRELWGHAHDSVQRDRQSTSESPDWQPQAG